MKKIITLSALTSILFGCGTVETTTVVTEVKSVDCERGIHFEDSGCSFTDINNNVYLYGDPLSYLNIGNKVELEVSGFNQIESIKYIDKEEDKNEK